MRVNQMSLLKEGQKSPLAFKKKIIYLAISGLSCDMQTLSQDM